MLNGNPTASPGDSSQADFDSKANATQDLFRDLYRVASELYRDMVEVGGPPIPTDPLLCTFCNDDFPCVLHLFLKMAFGSVQSDAAMEDEETLCEYPTDTASVSSAEQSETEVENAGEVMGSP
ncbi:uncharacterized protein LOC62_04G006101 [Vanrija pseudolonga]|uniref:Uncharacterized protein n=1 Tax=Vanrija pseudolonga TaxID=143232 RepID=A0AAF0YDQ6_9TREE|nr:hypothetical protein LOC62_04G006101 [Vanrija pseudolonga]